MPFLVYLKDQNPLETAPPHKASRVVAALVLQAGRARRIGKNAIQLVNDQPWGELKRSLRGRSLSAREVDLLLPPLKYYMAWNFPLPYSLLRHYDRDVA